MTWCTYQDRHQQQSFPANWSDLSPGISRKVEIRLRSSLSCQSVGLSCRNLPAHSVIQVKVLGNALHSTSIKGSKQRFGVVSPPGGRKSFDLGALEALKSSSHPDTPIAVRGSVQIGVAHDFTIPLRPMMTTRNTDNERRSLCFPTTMREAVAADGGI